MKKLTAALLAALLLLTACSGEKPAESGETTTAAAEITAAAPLSPEVALDENGDIDMERALSYQTDIDAFLKSLSEKEVNPADTVSDNTNEKTQKVFNYLRENRGSKVFAGQQMFSNRQTEDLVYYTVTGDLPAIKGFDLLFTTGSYANYEQVDMAIDWHKESGGLVSLCWHWNVPKDIDDLSKGYAFYRDEISNFSLKNAVTVGTKEYEQVIHDIDAVAVQLKRLEAEGVPVLWRPLHEASGQWFWWGILGRDALGDDTEQPYTKLWYILFDRLENYHKLTNLIWIWNGQSRYMEVDPNTYDIAATDIYPSQEVHTPQEKSYETLQNIIKNDKMIALSECGYIPDPDLIAESNAKWLYFMPWYGDFIGKASPTGAIMTSLDGTPSVNEERISEELLKKIYASENTITWSELPDWEGTKRELPTGVQIWQNAQKNADNS